VLLTLWPRIDLLVRNLAHWSDPDALIEPGNPRLEPLAADLARRADLKDHRVVPGEAPERDKRILKSVQDLVYKEFPYAWDWDTWFVADYMPTLDEVLNLGREDCDGRAVVAASLLKRLGYDAHLVSDLSHVWVWTPQGQTMSPMKTASGQTVVSAKPGQRSRVNMSALVHHKALLIDWPLKLSYGVAVFPVIRAAIIGLALWAVLLAWPTGRWWAAALLVLLAGGYIAHRIGNSDPWHPSLLLAWIGWASLAGVLALARFSTKRPRDACVP
jgi:hypothetical protein